jgi:hypothetical protein
MPTRVHVLAACANVHDVTTCEAEGTAHLRRPGVVLTSSSQSVTIIVARLVHRCHIVDVPSSFAVLGQLCAHQ